MKRPLKDIRPIGPFSQRNRNIAEVNVFFDFSNLAPKTRDEVEEAVEDTSGFTGPVDGPVGVQNDAITFQTTGNTVSRSSLTELMDAVEDSTGLDVEDIEVIW